MYIQLYIEPYIHWCDTILEIIYNSTLDLSWGNISGELLP